MIACVRRPDSLI